MGKRFSSSSFDQRKAELIVTIMFLVIASSANAYAETKISGSNVNAEFAVSERTARGLIRSNTKTEIRSDLRAPVSDAPFKPGHRFELGDTLIGFDCARYQVEWKAAKASANAAWIEYKSKKRLLAHQAVGKDEVRLAAANANRASAESEVKEVINADCKIKAPFSGRVVEAHTGVGEYATSDKPMLVILDDANLEIEILVPSNWLVWLRKDQALKFKIDETGQTISTNITRLGAEIDPVSRTIKVFAAIKRNEDLILSGMSGQAIFPGGS